IEHGAISGRQARYSWHGLSLSADLPSFSRSGGTGRAVFGACRQRCRCQALGHRYPTGIDTEASAVSGGQHGSRPKLCGTSVASVRTHRGTEAAWCCMSGCTLASGPFDVTSAAAGSRTAHTWCADILARTLESGPSGARYVRPPSRNAATSRCTYARTACNLGAANQPMPTAQRSRQPRSAFDKLKHSHHSVRWGMQVYFCRRLPLAEQSR
ncbi:hypothetical protein MTO96_038586, partial [Rhipicephalus appendiculatus]